MSEKPPSPSPPPEEPPAREPPAREPPLQKKNPLHGVTLEAMLTALVAFFGWPGLGEQVDIRCFTQDPSIPSSLKFLRRTPWARAKVESLYLFMLREQARQAAGRGRAEPGREQTEPTGGQTEPRRRQTEPTRGQTEPTRGQTAAHPLPSWVEASGGEEKKKR